jgi:hypothetical protein
MGAEPDSSLIGCVLVIHSAINRHESITHFKLYQWHVFERHEALLVLRVSLEEGVEDVLRRIEALKGKKGKTNTLESLLIESTFPHSRSLSEFSTILLQFALRLL